MESTEIIRQQVQSKQREALLLHTIKLWNYLASLWHSESTHGFNKQSIKKGPAKIIKQTVNSGSKRCGRAVLTYVLRLDHAGKLVY